MSKRRSGESYKLDKSHKKRRSGEEGLSAKQRMRVVSKAIISDSSGNSSSEDEEHQARVAALARKILSSDEEDSAEDVSSTKDPANEDVLSSDLSDVSGVRRDNKPKTKTSRSGRSRGQKRLHVSSDDADSDDDVIGQREIHEKKHSISKKLSPELENDDEDSDVGISGAKKRMRMMESGSDDDDENESYGDLSPIDQKNVGIESDEDGKEEMNKPHNLQAYNSSSDLSDDDDDSS